MCLFCSSLMYPLKSTKIGDTGYRASEFPVYVLLYSVVFICVFFLEETFQLEIASKDLFRILSGVKWKDISALFITVSIWASPGWCWRAHSGVTSESWVSACVLAGCCCRV